jgi:alpha-ribazole phosphatase
MPTRVSLIRHGQTDWNVSGRWQGQAAVPLNELGRQQAALLGEHLRSAAHEISAIFSSDSSRAAETAELITAHIGKPIQLDPRLREIDLGEWQGMTNEEVEAWDIERVKYVRSDSFNIPRPGGESFSQVADRALTAIQEFVAQHPDGHILVVSHGGTIRAMLTRLGLKPTEDGHIENTSLTALVHAFDDGDKVLWKLDVFNLLDHLSHVRLASSSGEQNA